MVGYARHLTVEQLDQLVDLRWIKLLFKESIDTGVSLAGHLTRPLARSQRQLIRRLCLALYLTQAPLVVIQALHKEQDRPRHLLLRCRRQRFAIGSINLVIRSHMPSIFRHGGEKM